MTVMNKFIFLTNKISNTGIGQLWVTVRNATDLDYVKIAAVTSYDLASEDITMMNKRLQSFKNSTPVYFQFLDNRVDPNDVRSQINMDIGDT